MSHLNDRIVKSLGIALILVFSLSTVVSALTINNPQGQGRVPNIRPTLELPPDHSGVIVNSANTSVAPAKLPGSQNITITADNSPTVAKAPVDNNIKTNPPVAAKIPVNPSIKTDNSPTIAKAVNPSISVGDSKKRNPSPTIAKAPVGTGIKTKPPTIDKAVKPIDPVREAKASEVKIINRPNIENEKETFGKKITPKQKEGNPKKTQTTIINKKPEPKKASLAKKQIKRKK
ncbi:MAG: hypothetical protein KKB81_03490 [Candidatus Margulisbacteria bacterium]|nr:hypothetical protein [Candidatus Margulisiibacteriota bacterium]